jgi:hypothetical protein
MARSIFQRHWLDVIGCPEGGHSYGEGFAIAWQRGPMGRGPDRQSQNGAFIEDVIVAVFGRLQFLQQGQFRCEENTRALVALGEALAALSERTARREREKTEGTHAGN